MKPHLSKEKPFNGAGLEGDDLADREYWCQNCQNRVTVSPSGEREYGHKRGCDYNPEAKGVPAA